MFLVVSQMVDGEFLVTDLYYDAGGVKGINRISGDRSIDWASTLDEISDNVGQSFYKSFQYVNAEKKDLIGFLGSSTEKFLDKYKDVIVVV